MAGFCVRAPRKVGSVSNTALYMLRPFPEWIPVNLQQTVLGGGEYT